MLFTTGVFTLLFLPFVMAGFFVLGRCSRLGAAAWLFVSSVLFYGYWMPTMTTLLLASICANFFVGKQIARHTGTVARCWMILGIVGNLLLLVYFKYANFLVDNLDALFGTGWQIGRVVLPIGISFFTFTQIAFLADAYQKGVREYKFIHYGLFVTYFPHLIAGPVLHHAQMMPQFGDARTYHWNAAHFAGGLLIFALGLAKKIVFADGISPYADAVFGPADAGLQPDMAEAWLGALSYTFQLYFDFSGYSDMAIGLSWMFNVCLPFNFNSPYRSTNISEFWRRWHMSLSSFLRDYLYIVLGGNRCGPVRRYLNLATTMLLGGLWHGASWSFVFWGGLHGLYLAINHAYRALCGEARLACLSRSPLYRLAAWSLTLGSVIVAWVFFRAETFAGAGRILAGMGGQVAGDSVHPLLWNAGLHLEAGLVWCAGLAAVAFLLPNSNQVGTAALEFCRRSPIGRGVVGGAALAATVLLVLTNGARDAVSAFIYFNF